MKWKGMCHAHIRGRSVHLDFRLQISKDLLVGWTLYIPKGLSKTPESYLESVELFRKEIEPIVKETLSNPSEKFNCGPKAPEPIEWATYEGRVEPSAIGATKNEYGDFIIIDEFEVQFGAQKAYFHEYFCDGKIFNGRIVFRLLENRKEWKKTDEGLMTWMAFNALTSPSPYAISARAVKKKWIPPAGVSALPRSIRKKIPQRYQYWQVKDPSKRMEIRDELVAEVKKKLLKLDAIGNAQFKFIKQTWKGQKVIREGPSRTQFFFILKQAKKYWAIALNADIGATPTAAGLPFQHSSLLWTVEGEVSPKSILNPSKNTPSRIEVLDRGKAIVLSEGKFKKFMLKGKKLKGLWVAYQQEGSKMWTFERSALPEPVRGDGSIVLEGGVI